MMALRPMLFGAIAMLAAGAAAADGFPEKNITILHAYSPGSSSSVTLRALGEAASKTLGKKVLFFAQGTRVFC